MSSPWLDRCRAERFAEVVDSDASGPRHHRRTPREVELAGLAELTQGLSRLSLAPDPDPEFRGSLRAFLVATAEREGIGAVAGAANSRAEGALAGKTQAIHQLPARSSTTGRTRLALVAGATLGAIVLSGVSVASTDSLPGDTLYEFKKSAERAQLAMAGSDISRGQLHLEFARARLHEAAKVDRAQLASALAEMDRQTAEGVKLLTGVAAAGDPAVLMTVAGFVVDQRGAIADLAQSLPAESRSLTAPSVTLLDQIEGRVEALTAALATPCPQPTSDRLGVDPATC